MRLLVDHLWTTIEGSYPESVVGPATSYFQDGYFFSPKFKKGYWDGRIKLLDKRKNRFPTGLLTRVCQALDKHVVDYEINDDREFDCVDPIYEFNGVKLRDYQRAALDTGLESDTGVFHLATGTGKAVCGAALIKSIGRKTLWITHRLQLARQMRGRLEKMLGQKVGFVGDGESDIQDVTVCMVQTLDRSEAEHRQDLRDFLSSVEVLIMDEIQHLGSDSTLWYDQILKTSARWRYGLSATPDFDGAGLRLTALTGPVLYRLSTADAISRGVLVPPRIWFIESQGPSVTSEKWASVYKEGIVENQARSKQAALAAKRLVQDGKRPLIVVRQIAHGRNIVLELERQKLNTDFLSGTTTPDFEVRDMMFTALETGTLDALVAQVETVGEGLDFPWLRAIINAVGDKGGGNASKGETGQSTIQVMGRGLRPAPGKEYLDYVDFIDTSNKALKKASKDRLGTLEAEGHGERIGFWRDYGSH